MLCLCGTFLFIYWLAVLVLNLPCSWMTFLLSEVLALFSIFSLVLVFHFCVTLLGILCVACLGHHSCVLSMTFLRQLVFSMVGSCMMSFRMSYIWFRMNHMWLRMSRIWFRMSHIWHRILSFWRG